MKCLQIRLPAMYHYLLLLLFYFRNWCCMLSRNLGSGFSLTRLAPEIWQRKKKVGKLKSIHAKTLKHLLKISFGPRSYVFHGDDVKRRSIPCSTQMDLFFALDLYGRGVSVEQTCRSLIIQPVARQPSSSRTSRGAL